MNLQLDGKTAFVSASTAGIGLSIATMLAREGARVIVNGRTREAVDEIVAGLHRELGAAARVQGFAGDLTTETAAADLGRRHPDVDILINHFGIFELARFDKISDADWRRFFDANVLSGVRLARLYLPVMRRQNWGRIIFTSSESALQVPAEMIHYGMTKAAQIAVARGLAESVAGTGITVNSVLPGPTRSRSLGELAQHSAEDGKSFEEFEAEFFSKWRPTSLLRRFITPDEVASLVVYLASPLASATTGAAYRVEGGVVKSAF